MKPLAATMWMARATSSGRPTRPAGVVAARPSNSALRWSAGTASHHGVSMTPGETALIRSGASSTASGGTIAWSAPLMAARPALPGKAARAEAAVIRVTEPSARIWGSADFRMRTCGQNLPSNPAASAARSSSAKGPLPAAPLTASTRWSIGPDCAKNASMSIWSAASMRWPTVLPPIRAAAAVSRSRLCLLYMPELPPITTTCCPAKAGVAAGEAVMVVRPFVPVAPPGEGARQP